MKSDVFNFHIPEHLIAQKPAEIRSESRLLVYNRTNSKIIDSNFNQLTDFLSSNDFLIFNNSKVIPARLFVKKKG